MANDVLVDGLSFGEGPRWHDEQLVLSDMHRHRVVAVGDDGAVSVLAQYTGPLSGIGWLPDGRLIVVAMDGDVLRLDPDGLRVHADLRSLASHGINDLIAHPGGWAYVGQFGYDREGGERPRPSPLIRVDADGSVAEAAADLTVANGMAITPDGATLFVAESGGLCISAFSIGDGGALSDRRVWAELPATHHPDGICLDASGGLWVACPMARSFVHVAPNGRIDLRVDVAHDRRAIACVLGGPDRRRLFMLTAATLGEAEASLAAAAARVEVDTVPVSGAGWP